MKPEEQRIAIASACGWKEVKVMMNHYGTEMGDFEIVPMGISPSAHPPLLKDQKPVTVTPDYLNDLNAIHKAENRLPATERDKYWTYLTMIVNRERRMAPTCWLCVNATAAQRAEAFLKTLSLWKD